MIRFFNWFNNLYPVWLVSLAIIAFFKPQTMLWFDKPWISLVARGVDARHGAHLEPRRLSTHRQDAGLRVALGFGAQYTIMPLCGWLVGWLLNLEAGLAVGIILVASCPGGMASNMISYLARANVALSVVLTLCSTMLAFFFTPMWTAGWRERMCRWMQMGPVPVRVSAHHRTRGARRAHSLEAAAHRGQDRRLRPHSGRACLHARQRRHRGSERGRHRGELWQARLAAFLLHVFGFGVGYAVSKVLRYPESVARTVSIEVGMQNGGMAASLGEEHFRRDAARAAAVRLQRCHAKHHRRPRRFAWWKRSCIEEETSSPDALRMSRRDIYYWKCDRPAAFHGTQTRGEADVELEPLLHEALQSYFNAKGVVLSPGAGQGNHLTWNAEVDGRAMFVRVENGPEKDAHLAVESEICWIACELRAFHASCVWLRCFAQPRAVRVAGFGANWDTRSESLVQTRSLDVSRIAFDIGQAVAKWQTDHAGGFRHPRVVRTVVCAKRRPRDVGTAQRTVRTTFRLPRLLLRLLPPSSRRAFELSRFARLPHHHTSR
jgi:BASS family bile acid:Na+ symporter